MIISMHFTHKVTSKDSYIEHHSNAKNKLTLLSPIKKVSYFLAMNIRIIKVNVQDQCAQTKSTEAR